MLLLPVIGHLKGSQHTFRERAGIYCSSKAGKQRCRLLKLTMWRRRKLFWSSKMRTCTTQQAKKKKSFTIARFKENHNSQMRNWLSASLFNLVPLRLQLPCGVIRPAAGSVVHPAHKKHLVQRCRFNF
jgi:hypothetical protein